MPDAENPLDRVLQQKQVGNAWSGHPVVFGYAANNAAEVKKYTTSTAWANNATKDSIAISGTSCAFYDKKQVKSVTFYEANLKV